MVASFQARAEYKFTLVDYPGAVTTLFWGINNAGLIVGQASLVDPVDGPYFDFTYDPGKGVFTPIPDVPGNADTAAIGLNENGTVVGTTSPDGVAASAFILDKKGEHTVFNQPGWDYTNARAIGSSGKVTGYSSTADFSEFAGFIYDPKDGSFIDIDFPNSTIVIPQGINGRGDVVGSVSFRPGGAPDGIVPRTYAFLRDKSGNIALFRINATLTRARGISDAGTITGQVLDPATGAIRGFVGKLDLTAGVPGVQYLTAPPVELLAAPGVFSTIPQGINNAGAIVGSTDDGAGFSHGFIATPLPSGKK
jgi:uncharacterized membrane protein